MADVEPVAAGVGLRVRIDRLGVRPSRWAWILRLGEPGQQWVRLAASVLATAVGARPTAFAIPSTLTLGLPLVALLALTLALISEQTAQGGSAG